MPARSRSNPLALAVLGSLAERPMHPYEIAVTLRERNKDESIRLNYGSLYSVVSSLERRGMIMAQETSREGRRPERTVYGLTKAGKTEMEDWLTELLGTVTKEYPQFEAGLSYMPALPPDRVLHLLKARRDALKARLDEIWSGLESAYKQGLPRLFGVESEYEAALIKADLEWTHRLVEEIEKGTLDGMDAWRSFHHRGRFDVDGMQNLLGEADTED